MKKTSKLFGAVALTAALTLGTAIPAFAAEGDKPGWITDSTVKELDKTAGSGETTVKMKTENTQIKVEIPLAIGFYAKSSGGDITVPTNSYKITNDSTAPVYITKVTMTDLSTGATPDWFLTKTVQKNATTGAIQQPDETENPAYGNLQLKATINTWYKSYNSSTPKAETKPLVFDFEKETTEYLNVAEDGTADNTDAICMFPTGATNKENEVVFAWSGTTSVLNKTDENITTPFKLTYVVSTNSANTTAAAGDSVQQTS